MLTKEQNDLLTRTGPGTPMGKLHRSYWQPVALAEELPPGGPPIPIRILGEDLVLFRDGDGRPGLLGVRCAHRGTDLSFGRVEGRGLRCVYHAWLFDVEGKCLEQPAEPAGSDFKDKVRQLAYPCREVAGVIFTYMGEGEPPELPAYEILHAPEEYRFNPIKSLHECNYLQGNEGNIDPSHLGYLHQMEEEEKAPQPSRNGDQKGSAYDDLLGSTLELCAPSAPRIDLEEADFGIRIYAVREADPGKVYVRITNFVMPNACAIAGITGQDGYQMDWHVPIDDFSHWKYTLAFTRSAPPPDPDWIHLRGELTPDYRYRRTRENRYLQDREEQRTQTFLGMGRVFQVHDRFAVEAQGPIEDRTNEHLGYADKAIAAARQMLLRALRDIEQGKEPPHVIRNPRDNDLSHLVVRAEVVPRETEVKAYWREGVGAVR